MSVPENGLSSWPPLQVRRRSSRHSLEFVDIAGLVRGASKGEGLGNQFLSHIREVDAIIYVLRCFEDGNITHVEGAIDPMRDADIVETELVLADLKAWKSACPTCRKKPRAGQGIA